MVPVVMEEAIGVSTKCESPSLENRQTRKKPYPQKGKRSKNLITFIWIRVASESDLAASIRSSTLALHPFCQHVYLRHFISCYYLRRESLFLSRCHRRRLPSGNQLSSSLTSYHLTLYTGSRANRRRYTSAA